ncbi:MAG: hypothetical protein AAGA56_19320 [Myxococcota bacterium]
MWSFLQKRVDPSALIVCLLVSGVAHAGTARDVRDEIVRAPVSAGSVKASRMHGLERELHQTSLRLQRRLSTARAARLIYCAHCLDPLLRRAHALERYARRTAGDDDRAADRRAVYLRQEGRRLRRTADRCFVAPRKPRRRVRSRGR